MKIGIKELLSPVHNAAFIAATLKDFESRLHEACLARGIELTDGRAGSDMTVYYVKSGGVENFFVEQFNPKESFYVLLTSDKHNSLPAALELHAYITQNGCQAEILHGSADEIAERLAVLAAVRKAAGEIRGMRIGVIGQPSDWLIASAVDYDRAADAFGIELIDIDLDILYILIRESKGSALPEPYASDPVLNGYKKDRVEEAAAVYHALKAVIRQYDLHALTLRCFDVVMSGLGTGCLALSLLNAEGVIAGCEGDIPAAISMIILNQLTGQPVFMTNPSRFDAASGEIVFAHCTVPWNMCGSLSLNTHFETGQGIGVKGELETGRATVFRLGSNLEDFYADEGTILSNGRDPQLCRTQITMALDGGTDYFTQAPLGNHHMICYGEQVLLLEDFFRFYR